MISLVPKKLQTAELIVDDQYKSKYYSSTAETASNVNVARIVKARIGIKKIDNEPISG